MSCRRDGLVPRALHRLEVLAGQHSLPRLPACTNAHCPLLTRFLPAVKHGESATPGGLRGSFSSPFGSLLDGSSRSAASPADGGGAGPGTQHPRQQRFAALFAQAGGALDAAAAALGTGDAPAAGSLDPSYLSPLRPPSSAAAAAARRSTSAEDDPVGGSAAAGDALRPQGSGAAAPGSSAGMTAKDEEELEEEAEEEEEFSVGSYRRRPPAPQVHRAGAPHTAAVAAQQRLFQPAQRPLRRRTLQFGGEEDEPEAAQLVRSDAAGVAVTITRDLRTGQCAEAVQALVSLVYCGSQPALRTSASCLHRPARSLAPLHSVLRRCTPCCRSHLPASR